MAAEVGRGQERSHEQAQKQKKKKQNCTLRRKQSTYTSPTPQKMIYLHITCTSLNFFFFLNLKYDSSFTVILNCYLRSDLPSSWASTTLLNVSDSEKTIKKCFQSIFFIVQLPFECRKDFFKMLSNLETYENRGGAAGC